MKVKLLLSMCFFVITDLMAQTSLGINHQAVIRDGNNQLVSESQVGIRVSIIRGTPEGEIIYSEIHTIMSNANGLISFIIGEGTSQKGEFNQIDWASDPYFIKTEADPNGGTQYTVTGISPVLSQPYALHTSALTLTSSGGQKYHVVVDDYGNITTTAHSGQPCPGIPVVTDVEGNVYNTVFIGGQCWMKENLKTTRYCDNTPIEYPGNDNNQWASNITGAYAWYNNNVEWKDIYGALYNWLAVSNTKGLCPEGWAVPSNIEFNNLIEYLGGNNIAGGKMKSTRSEPDPHPRWKSPNTGATNESNWTAYPGNIRHNDGSYIHMDHFGYWWTSTEYLIFEAYGKLITYSSSNFLSYVFSKNSGFSVRCIKR